MGAALYTVRSVSVQAVLAHAAHWCSDCIQNLHV